MKLIDILKLIIYESDDAKLESGNWGSVNEKDGNIIKTTEDDQEIAISKRLSKLKKNFKHFPIIYSIKKIGKNKYDEDIYEIVKKKYSLITKVPEYTNLIPIIEKYTSEIMAHIANPKNPLPEEVKEYPPLYTMIKGIIYEYSQLNLKDFNLLDFHIKNLGVDEQNNIVLFDY